MKRLKPYLIVAAALILSAAVSVVTSKNGGTGLDTSALTGCPSISSGTWSVGSCPTGTVTAVSVATANGISGTSSGGATPALTIALGAITPTSTNGVSATTIAFMDATSSVQTQLNGKQASLSLKSNCLTVTAAYPCVVAVIAPTTFSSTSSIGYTSFYTTANAGEFRICAETYATVAGSAGTAQAAFQSTFDGHVGNNGIGANNSITVAFGSPSQGCFVFYSDTGVHVLYNVILTGATGTPTIRYFFSLEELQ